MQPLMILKNGEVKMRLMEWEIRDGGVYGKSGKGPLPIVNASIPGASREQKELWITERNFEALAPFIAHMGENPGGLELIREDEWQKRERAKLAATIRQRELRLSKKGELVCVADTRDLAGESVVIHGVRFGVTGQGSPFDLGPHRVRYLYLGEPQIVEPSADNLDALRSLARDEWDRHRAEFSRMMEDGDNDGARPPRSASHIYEQLAKQMEEADSRAALILRCRAQADKDPSTTGGWMQGNAGKAALALVESGAPEEEVVAALEAYKSDPEYLEYQAGM